MVEIRHRAGSTDAHQHCEALNGLKTMNTASPCMVFDAVANAGVMVVKVDYPPLPGLRRRKQKNDNGSASAPHRTETKAEMPSGIFITESKHGIRNRLLSSRPSSSSGDLCSRASLSAGGHSAMQGCGTLQPVTRAQNAACGDLLTMLDRCVVDTLEGMPHSRRLQSISGGGVQAEPDQLSLRQAFDDCTALLDSRGACMQGLIAAFSAGDGVALPVSQTPPPNNITTVAVSAKPIFSTSATPPPGRGDSDSEAPSGRSYSKVSEIQRKMDTLREHPLQRRLFMREVGEVKRQRRLVVMEGTNHPKAHSDSVAYAAKSEYKQAQREKWAEGRDQRIATAQARVKALVNQKATRTRQKLDAQTQRLEMRSLDEARAANDCLRARVWLLAATLAHSVRTCHSKARPPSPVAQDNTPQLIPSDQPAGMPLVINTKMRKVRDPAKMAFIKALKRCLAAKHVRNALRDWYYVKLIPHNIKMYMAAVRTFQRYWRLLKKTRQYRRLMCSMQWEREIDELVKQVERRKTQVERERYSADKMQDAQAKKSCEQRVNALTREKGELRGILQAVKTEVIDTAIKEKEMQFGDRVMHHLRLRKEIRRKVNEWIENKKFMSAAFKNAPSKRRRGKNVNKVDDEATQALRELAARGEVVHSPQPIFPIVTPKPTLHTLIMRAKEMSREVVMKRLAANDAPTPPAPDAPPLTPSAEAGVPSAMAHRPSLLPSPRKGRASHTKRLSIVG